MLREKLCTQEYENECIRSIYIIVWDNKRVVLATQSSTHNYIVKSVIAKTVEFSRKMGFYDDVILEGRCPTDCQGG